MAGLADYRAQVQAQLQQDLAIPFVTGLIEGPVESGDIGCIFLQRVREMSARVEEAEITLQVRVFKQFTQIHDPATPLDTTALEVLLAQLQDSIKRQQTGIAPVWFQRLIEVQVDPARQCIEGLILGTAANAGLV